MSNNSLWDPFQPNSFSLFMHMLQETISKETGQKGVKEGKKKRRDFECGKETKSCWREREVH